jgi:hypothetical protein
MSEDERYNSAPLVGRTGEQGSSFGWQDWDSGEPNFFGIETSKTTFQSFIIKPSMKYRKELDFLY